MCLIQVPTIANAQGFFGCIIARSLFVDENVAYVFCTTQQQPAFTLNQTAQKKECQCWFAASCIQVAVTFNVEDFFPLDLGFFKSQYLWVILDNYFYDYQKEYYIFN